LVNRDEVINASVFVGAFTAVLGSIVVSLNTDRLTMVLPTAICRIPPLRQMTTCF
jgi:hypothetical protein